MRLVPRISRAVPAVNWLAHYRAGDLAADGLAGTIVAALLVPQAMAYALLAGLPPQAGLYTALVPLALYSIFGSSRSLAVGPVAVVSLLTADALAGFEPITPEQAMLLAALLAAGVGLIQLLLGALRLGFLANFLAHPVLAGFTNAAALTIAFSQAPHILGVPMERAAQPWRTLVAPWGHLHQAHAVTLAVALVATAILFLVPRFAGPIFARLRAPEWLCLLASRTAPLVVVVLGASVAFALDLSAEHGLNVVGALPEGLPKLAMPQLASSPMIELAPMMVTIALVGFLESFAVAQTLAVRRGETVDGNQEFVALGIANLGGSLTGAYPAAGGFGRSMVNHGAGARTGMASLVAAGLVALTLLGLTPLFFHLPRAALAAIIVVAVLPLIDFRGARRIARESTADGWTLAGTFVGVLALGVEVGLACGLGLSLVIGAARRLRGPKSELPPLGNDGMAIEQQKE